ncbi:hypothetical protein [Cerasicoccus arenae]|uniref:Uncharacterized protein n=1 Tax=Cerasicoccus arenae TaxID=424488 RepID=A0A8J3GCA7_9BACT|nr:hypothetical protein [Cerasicoccus arenae]MBK1860004.1 hypothetical protein [Cerasicoccus arenae]GHB97015.1 hypothetical protein GCM10007047_11240 [Cerasicoccus arenae]
MKIFKYFAAVLSFIIVSIFVAVASGALIVILSKPNPESTGWLSEVLPISIDLGLVIETGEAGHPVGIGFQWWNLPGTILGILGGIGSAKASIYGKQSKKANKTR